MYCQQLIFIFLLFLPNVLSFENGFLKLILRASQSLKEGSMEDFVTTTSHNYFPLENPQLSLCFETFYPDNQDLNPDYDYNGLDVHVPQEHKNEYLFIHNANGMPFKRLKTNKTNFPRVKHFNKKLAVLPYEPYQRVMTFAIEVCMIPTIWYLELVHCLYMGAAPYFTGMVMSYSLQDIVGSAIKTMGFLDESFSIENCHKSVSSFTDANINSRYQEICEAMNQCLLSNHFSSEKFSRLKDEFQQRIDKAYSMIESVEKVEQHKSYARHALLLSLSSKSISLEISHALVERNFLVIRAMVLSMSYLANKFIPMTESSISTRLSFITKLLGQFNFSSFKSFLGFCVDLFPKILGSESKSYTKVYRLFCMEFYSFGFVDETIQIVGEDKEAFNSAIKPSRILDSAYSAVIPSLNLEPDAPQDDSWLNFQCVEIVENLEPRVVDKKKKPKTMKYLKAAGSTSITRVHRGGAAGKTKKGLTQRLTKIFTNRKKRISKLITRHLGPQDN